MRSYLSILAVILAALALAAAGCGGDDDDDDGGGDGGGGGAAAETETQAETEAESGGGGGGGGAGEIKLTADPGGALKFDKTSITAKPGKVTVVMDNPSDVPHAVEIEGNGVEVETDTVTGSSSDLTADLKKGEYRFYCPVGNHADAGMEGTLTVK